MHPLVDSIIPFKSNWCWLLKCEKRLYFFSQVETLRTELKEARSQYTQLLADLQWLEKVKVETRYSAFLSCWWTILTWNVSIINWKADFICTYHLLLHLLEVGTGWSLCIYYSIFMKCVYFYFWWIQHVLQPLHKKLQSIDDLRNNSKIFVQRSTDITLYQMANNLVVMPINSAMVKIYIWNVSRLIGELLEYLQELLVPFYLYTM